MRRTKIRLFGAIIAAAGVGVFILAVSHGGSTPKRARRDHSLNRVYQVVFTISSTNAGPGRGQRHTP